LRVQLIYLYCTRRDYPELNSIVVQETGFPGDNYPDSKKPLEFLVERARVFTFNWTSKDKPRAEDFVGLAQSATT
jgi:hypothetical protein